MANFALYQAAWIACVLLAAAGRPGLASGVTLAAVGAHVFLAAKPRAELELVLVAGFVGLCVDSLQLALGVFEFPDGGFFGWLCPPWIVAMWMLFAITLRFCLSWLRGRYLLASLAGLAGGPLAFLAGERLGAVTFLEPRGTSFLILALVWAGALPLLFWTAARRDPGGPSAYRLPKPRRSPA